jgi:hypothetical protein
MERPADDILEPDERIVWVGRANSDRLLRRSDYAAVWGGIVLGVVATALLIATTGVMLQRATIGAAIGFLAGVALGALALHLVFGRFVRRFLGTRHAVYSITSTRVIAMRGPDRPGGEAVVDQVELTPRTETALQTHYEGRGTITVGALRLENIDDAAVVNELLQAQIAQLERS